VNKPYDYREQDGADEKKFGCRRKHDGSRRIL